MASGGPGLDSPVNIFEARLRTNQNAATNTLELLPYKGNRVAINRQTIRLATAGLTVGVGDNLINASGGDAGAAGAASTLYYVYVSNQNATFAPGEIRLSATSPTAVNGVKYLGSSGNALNWRFVGWVRLNATPNFESSEANALIVNYYNRMLYEIFANPGYVDGAGQSGYNVPANWAAANGGSGSQVKLIANGEDAEIIQTFSTMSAGALQDVYSGPGIDGVAPLKACRIGGVTLVPGAVDDSKVLSEGYHTVDLFCCGDVNGQLLSGLLRNGAASDPRASLVSVKLYI